MPEVIVSVKVMCHSHRDVSAKGRPPTGGLQAKGAPGPRGPLGPGAFRLTPRCVGSLETGSQSRLVLPQARGETLNQGRDGVMYSPATVSLMGAPTGQHPGGKQCSTGTTMLERHQSEPLGDLCGNVQNTTMGRGMVSVVPI